MTKRAVSLLTKRAQAIGYASRGRAILSHKGRCKIRGAAAPQSRRCDKWQGRREVYLAPGGRESKINGLAAAAGIGSTCTAALAVAKPLILQERGSEGKLQINAQHGRHSHHDPRSGNFKHLAFAITVIGSGQAACAKAKCMKLLSPPPRGRSERNAPSTFHNHRLSNCVNPVVLWLKLVSGSSLSPMAPT